jgi:hypothetical protein
LIFSFNVMWPYPLHCAQPGSERGLGKRPYRLRWPIYVSLRRGCLALAQRNAGFKISLAIILNYVWLITFTIPLATKNGLPGSPLARSWAIALFCLIVFLLCTYTEFSIVN